jgi:hypothetical protein
MKGLFAIVLLTLAIGLTVTEVFGFLGFGGTRWQEEALLHDGTKLIVERTVDRGGRQEFGQSPPIKEQKLTFTLPTSKISVTWKIEYSKDVGYADLSPIMLDIINDTPYLVTKPVGCLSYNKWERPNPPYIVFRYTNKYWQQIKLSELPQELKMPNLIISSPDRESERVNTRLITAELVKNLNSDLRQPEYKSIMREPLPQERIDWCVEKFLTKGGWTSIYIFKSQPTYEHCIDACKFKKVLPGHCPCDRLFDKHK